MGIWLGFLFLFLGAACGGSFGLPSKFARKDTPWEVLWGPFFFFVTILLNEEASLEELFAEIEIDTLRKAFREAQEDPEKIPANLKPIIAMHDFPEKLVTMVQKAVA